MTQQQPDPSMSERDKHLWKIAKKRVAFRRHLFTYIVINAFLWAIWLFGDGYHMHHDRFVFPWPIWCTLGWGIGIAFSYYGAYHSTSLDAIDKEYEKLKNKGS